MADKSASKGKPQLLETISTLALAGAVVADFLVDSVLAALLLGVSLVFAIHHVGKLIVWHKRS